MLCSVCSVLIVALLLGDGPQHMMVTPLELVFDSLGTAFRNLFTSRRNALLTEVGQESGEPKRPATYTSKVRLREKYQIIGFISSGTYGRVYKAVGRNGVKGEFAIKKYVVAVI